eukprot:3840153-Prymnesium_polylepis.1
MPWWEQRPAPVTPGAASNEWEVLHDDEGQPYYHNTATGQTTWEQPNATTADGSPLPPGWKAIRSPEGT